LQRCRRVQKRGYGDRVGALLDDRHYTCRQATYDLRRLKRKGLIVKLQRSHRYQLTDLGRRVDVLFTKTYRRILTPGPTALDPRLPHEVVATSVAIARRHLDETLDQFMRTRMVAA
jgi:hypothetical protein